MTVKDKPTLDLLGYEDTPIDYAITEFYSKMRQHCKGCIGSRNIQLCAICPKLKDGQFLITVAQKQMMKRGVQ